ncbi:hypothetical protein BDV96DRAFT_596514 [Lophiotrema nucula]|uniref:Uncharacterized protein n=1 Tax=Lophiotrema nucula TaxID=690887 RepID=A0A6A5ZHG7_9PLEO|nr:hypothetical protein BDV96DRAFT_596514 [Lophiotrema nucula]
MAIAKAILEGASTKIWTLARFPMSSTRGFSSLLGRSLQLERYTASFSTGRNTEVGGCFLPVAQSTLTSKILQPLHFNRQSGFSLPTIKPYEQTRASSATTSRVSNSDSGGPCDCTACREAARKPMCEICEIRPTTSSISGTSYDRKGIRYMKFTSFRDPCLEKHEAEAIERREARCEELALR